jgi:hypothetical protein
MSMISIFGCLTSILKICLYSSSEYAISPDVIFYPIIYGLIFTSYLSTLFLFLFIIKKMDNPLLQTLPISHNIILLLFYIFIIIYGIFGALYYIIIKVIIIFAIDPNNYVAIKILNVSFGKF